jgi:hypothetical protein
VLQFFSKGYGSRVELMNKMPVHASGKPARNRGRFHFWQQWLLYSSIAFAIVSVFFAIDGDNPVFETYNRAMISYFWSKDNVPEELPAFLSFVRGPMGGTMTCCYIMLAYIAAFPFKNKERWARNAIIAGFGGWVLLDSAVCLYHGLFFQVFIINLFSVVVKALPLIYTRRAFKQTRISNNDPYGFPFLEN